MVLRNSLLALYKYEFMCTIEGFSFLNLKVNFLNLAFIGINYVAMHCIERFLFITLAEPINRPMQYV